MSQHHFTTPATTGEMLRVMCGYDRPLDYFFLQIEPIAPQHTQRRDLHFDTLLATKTGGYHTPDQVLHRLHAYELTIPRGLLLALQDDEKHDRHLFRQKLLNNRITHWPLAEQQQREWDAYVDSRYIEEQLSCHDNADEEQLLQVLLHNTIVLQDIEQLALLIYENRMTCLLEPLHVIDWHQYFPTIFIATCSS